MTPDAPHDAAEARLRRWLAELVLPPVRIVGQGGVVIELPDNGRDAPAPPDDTDRETG